MLMSNPPNFDHVTSSTNHHSFPDRGLYQSHHHDRHKERRAASKRKNPNLQNQSVLSNNSAMNFYPPFLQPTRMSDIVGAGRGSTEGSVHRAQSTRTSLKYSSSQSAARTVSFYRSGDTYMQAFKVAITNRNFRTFDSLLEALSDRIPLPFGVRTVSTPRGTHGISRLEEFEDGKSYVCSDKKTVKPLDLTATRHPRPPWFISKPKTRTKAVAQLVRRPDAESYRVPLRLTQVKTPKKIVVVRNGDPNFRHTLLMSRRTPQSFENILDDLGEIFRIRVHKLYTSDGRKIESLQSLFLGPTIYVAAGREAFQPMEYRIKRVAIQDVHNKDHVSEQKNELNKERTPKELKKTKGRWQVSIVTSELAAAATDSHVTITVYGVKGNTGPILLNGDNKATFKSGSEDQFAINVGSIGEIRKIRIAHDNSGAFPGWLCESVTLTDATTGEIHNFPCNRWLSRDEEDGEICREIPATVGDKPILPVTTYDVSVSTGNLWNAGTSASIYITMFGNLGDSGPRLLQLEGNPDMQIKGRTHRYKFEAVSLGVLHRLVVGHDEQKPGDGWYLDKIVVQEERIGVEEWIFPCDRWLDAGEEDGKTIRELYAESEMKGHSHWKHKNEAEKFKIDHMWEIEKWKYQKGNQIVLISQATEKALRVRSDAAIDGLGDPSLPTSTFEILRRRNNVRVFSNVGQRSFHIAMDQNRTLGHGKGGSFSEFYVKVQRDRSVQLESCRYSGQHVTVDPSGRAADTRGHPNAPGKTFYVYVKGCFRHNSIVLLNTSTTQVLAMTSSGDITGTGRRAEHDITDVSVPTSNREKQFGHFRVVKVAEGVRMFQCEKDRKRFLRIKDGRCDGWGNGDVYCHFKVHKHRVGSYVTLESMKNRGVFIGLDSHGKARPTVNTGDENNQLFPEVVSWGKRRKERAEEWKDLEPTFTLPTYDETAHSDTYRISSRSKSKLSTNTVITLKEREHTLTGPVDGDFRIYVTTGNLGTTESIALHVYGDKGSSGPIILGKGIEAGVFQTGQTDEFQANLAAVGEIRKIRIGAEEMTSKSEWRLKQVKMKDMNSNQVYRFKFNRWLARTKEDGSTLRELPMMTSDGKPVMPILRYHVIIRTSAESARLKKNTSTNQTTTQHEIYICIHGEYGDTGRRLLLQKPSEFPDEIHENKALFAPGQTDKFKIEAVSLGELTKCVVSCPSISNSPQTPAPSWLCEEIIIRESEGATHEYSFRCQNKWLGTRKVGAKPQVKMELAEKREIKRNTSDDNLFEEGDWKVSVTTGIYENCGTTSNVMFYACGTGGTSSGPIFFGSGTKGLFAAGTTEQFKVNLADINELEKIRLSHDNSGSDSSWFVDRIKLQSLSTDVTHSLDVKKWLSASEDPYQLCVEIPIPKPGVEVPAVLRYQVFVYTGGILGSDTDANVFMTIYGKKGDTSRRTLVKSLNHDIQFQESQVDVFEVEAVDLGELTKIEIGHDGVGHGNGWFLHKLIIKETPMSPKDYIFFCNRWLDDGQDDGKIVRIIQAELSSSGFYALHESTIIDAEPKLETGENHSADEDDDESESSDLELGKVASTPLSVTTPSPNPTPDGGLSDSDAKRTITAYLNMKRKESLTSEVSVPNVLRQFSDVTARSVPPTALSRPLTSSTRPVTSSTEAVTSKSKKRNAEHDAIVSESEGFIEDTVSEGKFRVAVTTGHESADTSCPADASVSMVLYGEEGKTGEILLKPEQDEDDPQKMECFKAGQTDEFKIDVVDIGKIYKVRLDLDYETSWKGLYVEELMLEDTETKQQVVFKCNRWLSKTEDDQETIREFAVARSDADSLPAKVYCVNVTTGDRPGASTDANVYVTLRGERGDSGRRLLRFKNKDDHLFRRNQTATFMLEAVDLGKLTEVVVGHDGKGYGAGWFLKKVTVKESEESAAECVFPAHCWLDDHVGDCKIVRKLNLLGQFHVPNSIEEEKLGSSQYEVTVLVDEVMTQANSEVNLTGIVYDSNGKSESIPLGGWRPGREKKFDTKVDLSEIEEITKLRVEMEDSHLDLNLYLISVQLESVSGAERYEFNFHRHFRSSSGSTSKELPVVRGDKPYQRNVSYLISVNMQLVDEEAPSQGRLELKLTGTNSDSGYRVLFRGMDGLNAIGTAEGYVFEHESVDLQELQDVSLKYVTDDVTNEGGWKIGDIVIKKKGIPNFYAAMDQTEYGYIASADRIFNPTSDSESQFLLEKCKIEPEMEESFKDFKNELVLSPIKEPTAESNGSWILKVTSAPYDQASMFNQISMKLFGSMGASDDVYLSAADVDDIMYPGEKEPRYQTRTMGLELGTELGDLYRLRLMVNKESTAEIQKIKLKDSTTGDEFLCFLSSEDRSKPDSDEDGMFIYDFLLLKPDQEPLSHHTYEIAIATGNLPSSDTDADVNIEIFGQYGSTGSRSLKYISKDADDLFQLGQVDNFSLETADVGEPQKILLSHTSTGGGAGWYPKDVTITESRENAKTAFTFSCQKWLDDSVDDKLLQREFYVTGTKLLQKDVDVTKSKGIWKCQLISMSDIIKKSTFDVKFTFCMNDDQSYESVHHVTDENCEFDFSFSDKPDFDSSTSKFLKLRTEIENTSEKAIKKWPLLEFLMTDVDSNEKLRFVFDGSPVWEGSARGHVRELPVVRANQPHQPVYDYYVIFSTSNQSSRDFVPSSVFCQLRGTNGSTGWREIVSSKNVSGKFRPGRIDVFNIESVNLGDVVDDVMIKMDESFQQQWKLSRVKVKRDFYDEEEQVFDFNKEVKANEITTIPLSKNTFNYPPKAVSKATKTGVKASKEELKYQVSLTWEGISSLQTHWSSANSDKVTSRTLPTLALLLGDNKGSSSDAMTIDLEKVKQLNGKSISNLEVPVSTKTFGELSTIGLGVLDPALPADNSNVTCLLRKITVKNEETDQYHAFRLRHNFFSKSSASSKPAQTGLNWIELAATRPRQDPKTIAKTCSYDVKIRTADREGAGTKAHVYVILNGKNCESGKRWLMTSSIGEEVIYLPGQTVEFSLQSIFLDELNQITIGHDARDVDSAWLLDNVIVTSSLLPNMHFVFTCQKWLANLQEDTFIERTLTLDHVINDDQ